MKLKTTLIICLIALFAYEGRSQCTGAQFQEVNGIAVVEAENGTRPSAWPRETSVSGATGGAYMAYRGSNSFSTPSSAVARYTVRINSTGTYRFVWRNRIGIIASHNANTEHNDSWLRIPGAANFYAQRGSSRIFPRGSGKSPNPEGASANGYFKVYTNTMGWNWATNTSDNDPHQIFVTFSSPGVYTIEIAGRSKGHFIDRFVLFKPNQYSLAQAQSTTRSQTTCDGSSNPPPPPPPPPSGENEDPTVNITNPDNGQNFNAGSDVSINLSANDPDGSISKHEIFVNGSKVDTDGSNYTPHVIRNIAAGSYTIRAKVTDNDGGTDDDTVSITVGGSNDPPPPPPPSGENNPPTVSITSPNNGANFDAGSTVNVNLSASDSDGSVVRHRIWVNGSLVDTDGSNFTPHPIRNVTEGNYTVRAQVTDNEGATAEATASFTVGGGSEPPPPPPPPPSGGGGITFTLINANTNGALGPMPNGNNISFPNDKNIRANSSFEGTRSVYFRLTGPRNQIRTENAEPYALFGDNNGNYASVDFPVGQYTLTAEAWSGANRSGTMLGTATINFSAGSSFSSKSVGEVYVFPNPIKDGKFSVKVPEEVVGEVNYSLISTSGAAIEAGKITVDRAGENAEFNLDSFNNKNNGVYYLILQSKGSSYTVPLVKQ